jgi:hypothetical protein
MPLNLDQFPVVAIYSMVYIRAFACSGYVSYGVHPCLLHVVATYPMVYIRVYFL